MSSPQQFDTDLAQWTTDEDDDFTRKMSITNFNKVDVSFDVLDPVDALAANRAETMVCAAGSRGVLRIFSVTEEGLCQVVDLRGRVRKLNLLYSPSNVAWSHIKNELIATTSTNGAVVLWNVEMTKIDRHYKVHNRSATVVQFHPDHADLVVSGSKDSMVVLYDIRSKRAVASFKSGAVDTIRDIKFVGDRTNVSFLSADDSGAVRVWDIRNPSKVLRTLTVHSGYVSSLSVCVENPSLIASGGGRDKLIRVWSWESEFKYPLFQIDTMAPVGRVAWRPGSRYQLASCAVVNDLNVHVWDIRRCFLPLLSFEAHRDSCTDVWWGSKSPERFISSGKDGLVVLHQLNEGGLPLDFACDSAVDVSPQGVVGIAVNAHLDLKTGNSSKASATALMTQGTTTTELPVIGYAKQNQLTQLNSGDGYNAFEGAVPSQLSTGVPDTVKDTLGNETLKNLAIGYRLGDGSLRELCVHNSEVAERLGETRIAQIWRLVDSLITDTSAQEEYDETQRTMDEVSKMKWNKFVEDMFYQGVEVQWAEEPDSEDDESTGLVLLPDRGVPRNDPHRSNGEKWIKSIMGWHKGAHLMSKPLEEKSTLNTLDFYFGDGELRGRYDENFSEEPMCDEFMGLKSEAFDPCPNRTAHALNICDTALIARLKPGNDNFAMVAEIAKYRANQGDFQTAVAVCLVAGKRILNVLEKYLLDSWMDTYHEQAEQLGLFVSAAAVRNFSLLNRRFANVDDDMFHHMRHGEECQFWDERVWSRGFKVDDEPCVVKRGHSSKCGTEMVIFCALCDSQVPGMMFQCNHCGHTWHLDHAVEYFTTCRDCPVPGCGCLCYDVFSFHYSSASLPWEMRMPAIIGPTHAHRVAIEEEFLCAEEEAEQFGMVRQGRRDFKLCLLPKAASDGQIVHFAAQTAKRLQAIDGKVKVFLEGDGPERKLQRWEVDSLYSFGPYDSSERDGNVSDGEEVASEDEGYRTPNWTSSSSPPSTSNVDAESASDEQSVGSSLSIESDDAHLRANQNAQIADIIQMLDVSPNELGKAIDWCTRLAQRTPDSQESITEEQASAFTDLLFDDCSVYRIIRWWIKERAKGAEVVQSIEFNDRLKESIGIADVAQKEEEDSPPVQPFTISHSDQSEPQIEVADLWLARAVYDCRQFVKQNSDRNLGWVLDLVLELDAKSMKLLADVVCNNDESDLEAMLVKILKRPLKVPVEQNVDDSMDENSDFENENSLLWLGMDFLRMLLLTYHDMDMAVYRHVGQRKDRVRLRVALVNQSWDSPVSSIEEEWRVVEEDKKSSRSCGTSHLSSIVEEEGCTDDETALSRKSSRTSSGSSRRKHRLIHEGGISFELFDDKKMVNDGSHLMELLLEMILEPPVVPGFCWDNSEDFPQKTEGSGCEPGFWELWREVCEEAEPTSSSDEELWTTDGDEESNYNEEEEPEEWAEEAVWADENVSKVDQEELVYEVDVMDDGERVDVLSRWEETQEPRLLDLGQENLVEFDREVRHQLALRIFSKLRASRRAREKKRGDEETWVWSLGDRGEKLWTVVVGETGQNQEEVDAEWWEEMKHLENLAKREAVAEERKERERLMRESGENGTLDSQSKGEGEDEEEASESSDDVIEEINLEQESTLARMLYLKLSVWKCDSMLTQKMDSFRTSSDYFVPASEIFGVASDLKSLTEDISEGKAASCSLSAEILSALVRCGRQSYHTIHHMKDQLKNACSRFDHRIRPTHSTDIFDRHEFCSLFGEVDQELLDALHRETLMYTMLKSNECQYANDCRLSLDVKKLRSFLLDQRPECKPVDTIRSSEAPLYMPHAFYQLLMRMLPLVRFRTGPVSCAQQLESSRLWQMLSSESITSSMSSEAQREERRMNTIKNVIDQPLRAMRSEAMMISFARDGNLFDVNDEFSEADLKEYYDVEEDDLRRHKSRQESIDEEMTPVEVWIEHLSPEYQPVTFPSASVGKTLDDESLSTKSVDMNKSVAHRKASKTCYPVLSTRRLADIDYTFSYDVDDVVFASWNRRSASTETSRFYELNDQQINWARKAAEVERAEYGLQNVYEAFDMFAAHILVETPKVRVSEIRNVFQDVYGISVFDDLREHGWLAYWRMLELVFPDWQRSQLSRKEWMWRYVEIRYEQLQRRKMQRDASIEEMTNTSVVVRKATQREEAMEMGGFPANHSTSE